MALTQFENQDKQELSLVEIATALLEESGKALPFATLIDEMVAFLGVDKNTFDDRAVQFYTDLNADGSFISLGNNVWGLREWYPVDSIDENIHDEEDAEFAPTTPKKKAKKVNVFADSLDDDVIDYNDDDPEDDTFDDVEIDDDEEETDDDLEENEEAIDDHLNELAGGDDLDDLSDGDSE